MKKAKTKVNTGKMRRILLSKPFCISVLAIMSVLALVCIIKLVLGFMPVKNYTVEGITSYDITELISASGIKTGDSLYKIDERKVAETMVRKCPYLKTVTIKQKFPNTVCFVVKEEEPGWYVQVGYDFYALDYDMKVLFETYDEEPLTERKLTKLTLPELEEITVGSLPKFAGEDEQLRKETLEIIDAFRTHSTKNILTLLDLSNRFEIKLEINNEFFVYFGDMTSFEIKMKALSEVIKKAEEEYGYGSGTVTWDENSGTFALKGEFPDPSETEEGGESESGESEEDTGFELQ